MELIAIAPKDLLNEKDLGGGKKEIQSYICKK